MESSELSINETTMAKGVAILFMLFLHLFAKDNLQDNYDNLIFLFNKPVIYYVAVFCSCCVPIYFFLSGYALYLKFENTGKWRKFGLLKLMINYWIVLLLTCLVGYYFGFRNQIPGSLTKFAFNIIATGPRYSGAWWFIQTYAVIVLLSPLIFKMVIKFNSLILFVISGIIYFISFIADARGLFKFENNIVEEFRTTFLLFGTSQFSFVLGALFYKNRIFSKLIKREKNTTIKNIVFLLSIIILILLSGLTEQYIIRPLSGVLFLCLFYNLKISPYLKKALLLLGKHSTNIWLTHMLIYATFLPAVVFFSRIPIVVFIWLVILSLCVSMIINILYHPIINLINSKYNKALQKINVT